MKSPSPIDMAAAALKAEFSKISLQSGKLPGGLNQ
jgi:hypothetical protein